MENNWKDDKKYRKLTDKNHHRTKFTNKTNEHLKKKNWIESCHKTYKIKFVEVIEST